MQLLNEPTAGQQAGSGAPAPGGGLQPGSGAAGFGAPMAIQVTEQEKEDIEEASGCRNIPTPFPLFSLTGS